MAEEEPIIFLKRRRPGGQGALRETARKYTIYYSDSDSECEEKSNSRNDMDGAAENDKEKNVKKRLRVHGVSLEKLNSSAIKLASEAKTNMTAAEKQGLIDVQQLEKELALNNTFSAETNRRDEDAEMLRYIEEELERKRREKLKEKNLDVSDEMNDEKIAASSSSSLSLASHFRPGATIGSISDDVLLKSLPKHLLTATSDEKSEEMLSSQMLTGIPEVDLGVDEKIRNIEATEEARQRLVQRQSSRNNLEKTMQNSSHRNERYQTAQSYTSLGSRAAVPTPGGKIGTSSTVRNINSSVKIGQAVQTKVVEELTVQVGQEPKATQFKQPVQVQERRPARDRASDTYHLTKFKKAMNRK